MEGESRMEKNILVIDDEKLVTKTLQKLLKREGYNAVVATNGMEAIEKIKAMDFDLIISDVKMPELDGIETIKYIRDYLKKSNRRLLPEILITGYANGDKYEKALDLEVVDYLPKPFDNKEFLQIIKKTIG